LLGGQIVDVGAWLRNLGLDQYEQAFRDNAVDEHVLPDLTAEDLKDLGVVPVGDRRKLLSAIAHLQAQAAPPAARSQPHIVEGVPQPERRQLTILFCDLVGSTALSVRFDPEDLREVVRAYHTCVAEVVQHHGGFVAKYMGDGVLAYFGYPQAREDAAEQAVRTGLALVDAVSRLSAGGEHLQVRVGIATGLVIVGDLLGSGAAQERSVVGETPNLAARLQALAEPGTVVIAPGTRQLVGQRFECRDAGAVLLKGFSQPVQAWEVVAERSIDTRFEALRFVQTPLVGRDEEVDLLLRRWQQSQNGQGQVVLISGEPGIGKSRLTASLQERITGTPHTKLSYFCSPRHSDSALYPVINQLRRAAGFQPDDTSEQRLDKLETLLGPPNTPIEDQGLLANLMSLPTDNRFPSLSLSPQARKERTLAALMGQIEISSRSAPTLIVWEDVHWIDPTSLELLHLIVDHLQALPVLLVVTFRPEFSPPWADRPHVITMALDRLNDERSAMIAARTAGKALPPEVLGQIATRAEGVPLFVEELTKAVLESSSVQDRGDHFILDKPLLAGAIPVTLNDVLMARLDRSPGVKEIAQTASVIGREFSHEMIRAVSDQNDGSLQGSLDQLAQGGLLVQRGVPPQAMYVFKHALVQDVSYSSLLRDRRQRLHARIAYVLLDEHRGGARPETVAHHCTEGGLLEQAVRSWREAGDQAARQYANQEAIAHYRRGLTVLERLPPSVARDELELGLLTALGPVLMMVLPNWSPEVKRIYDRARQVAREHERSKDLFVVLWGNWLVAYAWGQRPLAQQFVQELYRLADELKDPGYRLQTQHAEYPMAFFEGKFARALELTQSNLDLYDEGAHRDHALIFAGHDPGVCASCFNSLALLMVGNPDQALRGAGRSLALAHKRSHPPTLAHALRYTGDLYHLVRNHDALIRHANAVAALPEEQRSAAIAANAQMLLGLGLILRGELRAGSRELRQGLAAWRASGETIMSPYQLCRTAEGFLMAGDQNATQALLEEAFTSQEQTGEYWIHAELLRLRGELRSMEHRAEQAEQDFSEALSTARGQGARWFELRAATGLAHHWLGQGRGQAAHDLLSPVLDSFTEGLGTFDLQAAKALLALCQLDGER
jgi:class 3 adenylate cyclase/predicted ATPase